MTRILVYEYCVATGLGREASDPAHSLYREGRAMFDAVTADLRAVPGVEVVTVEGKSIAAIAASSDWAIIVAPEFERTLESLAEIVTKTGCRLLNPSIEAISLTSDKFRLAEHWFYADVPTPRTELVEASPSCRVGTAHHRLDTVGSAHPTRQFPVVFKPRDGAGSDGVVRCVTNEEWTTHLSMTTRPVLVQPLILGRAASVAFLIGPSETIPLQPTFQLLSDDGRFTYLGGELPIPSELAERAITLGRRAVACVPGLLGYVGVDLVLGDAADGSADYAIEINPRLTTSYVGLRQLADFNIAEMMLRLARNEPVGPVRWKPGRIRFRPDGAIEPLT